MNTEPYSPEDAPEEFSQAGETMDRALNGSNEAPPAPLLPLPHPSAADQAIWVGDEKAFAFALKAVQESPLIFMDLEADSLHHYHAKICLLQILTVDGTCMLIDSLAGFDIAPLVQILASKPLILHGADYDLRMLGQEFGFRGGNVFDTMLAAQLLGRKAFGLAALVKESFGIPLEKGPQKDDWSQRPLPEKMRHYAALDTLYLPGLYGRLMEELATSGRADWHRQICEALTQNSVSIRKADPDEAWRITGSNRMYPRQLAVLKALWEVRESIAAGRDRPPFKVLPSEIMLRFADGVRQEGDLPPPPRLPSRLPDNEKAAFIQAYEISGTSEPESWPTPLKTPRRASISPNPELVMAFKDIRDSIAQSLNLDPSVLAPRNMLVQAALIGLNDTARVREATGWLPWQEALLLGPWRAKTSI